MAQNDVCFYFPLNLGTAERRLSVLALTTAQALLDYAYSVNMYCSFPSSGRRQIYSLRPHFRVSSFP